MTNRRGSITWFWVLVGLLCLALLVTATRVWRSKTVATGEQKAVSGFEGFSKDENRFQVALITNGPLNDWGFNYAHYQGVEQVQKVLGDRVKIGAIGNVPETGDAERIMRRLIENGVDLIIAASFGYQDTTVKLANEFPKVKFLQAWGFKPAQNLGTYSSKMYQAWYVEGIVAGLMTKTNKLGIVAAHPIPPMKWQINAYVLGARSVNPSVTASVTFINSWFDPGLAAEATEALIGQGCDVVTGVLDNSVAVAQTAEKRGTMLIGHNADLSRFAPNVILGGTQWLWGKLYENAIGKMLTGNWVGTSGDLNGGFAEGYVGITGFGPRVSEEVRTRAMAAVQGFKQGALAVYRGPIKDNQGVVRVAEGQVLSHNEIMGMDWLVEGVR
jgi:basic membrane protein A and related proteins